MYVKYIVYSKKKNTSKRKKDTLILVSDKFEMTELIAHLYPPLRKLIA